VQLLICKLSELRKRIESGVKSNFELHVKLKFQMQKMCISTERLAKERRTKTERTQKKKTTENATSSRAGGRVTQTGCTNRADNSHSTSREQVRRRKKRPPRWKKRASNHASSDVQSVRLSRMSCMSNVESLYESSLTSSSLSIAASNPSRAIRHASWGLFKTS